MASHGSAAAPDNRMWKLLLSLAAMLLATGLLLVFFPRPILALGNDGGTADVLVVPGGDGEPRSLVAAQLWHQGRAPKILITGDGDCYNNKLTMLLAGVPASAIQVECISGSTWLNAKYSAPFLHDMGAKSAIIVTNWFHARRALASFRTACPQMRFSVFGVGTGDLYGRDLTEPERIHVSREYAKLAGYILLGRASLWSLFASNDPDKQGALCEVRGAT